MSSLAGSRRSYVPRHRGLRRRIAAVRVPLPDPAPWLIGGIALAIALTAFVAGGGSQLERTTWTEVGLMIAGASLCALALLMPRHPATPRRFYGAWSLTGFALLAALTAASITWSLMPADSWFEANRTFAYLAAFAGGLALGRLVPTHWSAILHGVAIASVLICAWALLTKVFPAALAPDETFARLRPPFDYWNSVGLAAAIGLPPLLWLAARRSGHAAVNALAWPAVGILVAALMLSFSRGALVAVAIGAAAWLILVPLRLRIVVVLGCVLTATVPLVAWAFAQEGLARDRAPMALRVDSGLELGALLFLLLVMLTIAGLAIGFVGAVHPPGTRTTARASRVLVGALAVVPAIAILMLANAPGGVDGQISKAWRQATDPAVSGPSNDPSRLTATSSGRARYWREAWKVHRLEPVLGTGAGAYATVRMRYRLDARTVRHAHGYVVQTLADLGWAGLGVSLLALIAWLAATVRVLGLRPRDRGLRWDAERVGLATLACAAVVFGVHSAIDWTWFIPGNVVPAMLCAGWVVSRPPLRRRMAGADPVEPSPFSWTKVSAAALVAAIALIASWAALQPVRSSHAQDASVERLEQGALPQAASIAEIAHRRNPLAVDPLFELAAIETRRDRPEPARRALERAVDLEPANPETWRRLAAFRLGVLNDPRGALRAYQAAYFLDPKSARSVLDVVDTSRLVSGG